MQNFIDQDFIDIAWTEAGAPAALRQSTAEPDMRILADLDAKGGHGEAAADWQGAALAALMDARFIERTAYRGGLVMYEITKSGRRFLGERAAIARGSDKRFVPPGPRA